MVLPDSPGLWIRPAARIGYRVEVFSRAAPLGPFYRAECVGGRSRAFKSPQGSAPSLDGVGGYLAMTGTPWELKLEGFCCHAVQSLTLWILPVNDRLATANLAGQLS